MDNIKGRFGLTIDQTLSSDLNTLSLVDNRLTYLQPDFPNCPILSSVTGMRRMLIGRYHSNGIQEVFMSANDYSTSVMTNWDVFRRTDIYQNGYPDGWLFQLMIVSPEILDADWPPIILANDIYFSARVGKWLVATENMGSPYTCPVFIPGLTVDWEMHWGEPSFMDFYDIIKDKDTLCCSYVNYHEYGYFETFIIASSIYNRATLLSEVDCGCLCHDSCEMADAAYADLLTEAAQADHDNKDYISGQRKIEEFEALMNGLI